MDQVLLARLLAIYKNGPPRSGGICHAVSWFGDGMDSLVCELAMNWSGFSGNIRFPVPAPEGGDPIDAYCTADMEGTMWDKSTEYGRNRWELLNYLIGELSK